MHALTENGSKLDRARTFIEQNLDARQVNKVLHGFPSPRLWLEQDPPIAQIMSDHHERRMRLMTPVDLYMAVPYCLKTEPGKCGYCLFPVEEFTGNDDLEIYFEYLKREGRMYRRFFEGDKIARIYFGGGTSNLYRAHKYPELMALIREVFPEIPPGISITLEGIPQLFTREKLAKIKEAGMNRVSMGAQQLNDELNKLSGRKQTVRHVIEAVEWCQELGLDCNVDLIFGWPRQTVATMVKDLELLISTGIREITHYELNVGGPTDFALNRRDEMPTTLQNLEMYRVSRDLLKAHGFRQITAYNWHKGPPAADRQEYEEGKITELRDIYGWGWGYAGCSFFARAGADPGWFFINQRSVAEYKRAIDEDRFPVEHAFHAQEKDFRLAQLFRALAGMEVDRVVYADVFGVDLVEEYQPIWQALEERGFVTIEPGRVGLVGDGVFYTPMIQTLLSSERLVELQRSNYRKRGRLAVAD